jgi:hypothetical protein
MTLLLALQMEDAIEEPLRILGGTVELLDTQNDTYTFHYRGPIRHQIGIEAYAKQLIKKARPETVDVIFLTNRVRDLRDE